MSGTSVTAWIVTTAFLQNEFGYASVLAVVLGVVGVGIALALVRVTGFGSMRSQQEGAT